MVQVDYPNHFYSPWGKVEWRQTFAKGFYDVSTPGHGGFMLSKGFARKHLSKAAYIKGESYGQYLCYEEDCAFAIVLFDLFRSYPLVWCAVFPDYNEQMLIEHLSRYYSTYLLSLGIKPVVEIVEECFINSVKRLARDTQLNFKNNIEKDMRDISKYREVLKQIESM